MSTSITLVNPGVNDLTFQNPILLYPVSASIQSLKNSITPDQFVEGNKKSSIEISKNLSLSDKPDKFTETPLNCFMLQVTGLYNVHRMELDNLHGLFGSYMAELELNIRGPESKIMLGSNQSPPQVSQKVVPTSSNQVPPQQVRKKTPEMTGEMKRKYTKQNVQVAKKKRKTNFQKDSIDHLQVWFYNHLTDPYPNDEDKRILSTQTGLSVPQVNNWFGNKRMRYKRKMLEQDKSLDKSPSDVMEGDEKSENLFDTGL
jgi:hypothetical protein